METIRIGVIGGSGVYSLDGLKIIEELDIDTPFGKPSDKIVIGELGGRKAAFLPRHGRTHRYTPSEVPQLANIYAFKMLGVEKIVSVSAVGSLKEEIRPTDFILPRQIVDRTKNRPSTFFGGGIVGHIAFADPFCEETRAQAARIIGDYFRAKSPDKKLFTDETLVVMEGPQFSTRAESRLYKSWGAGIIGMTALPEAKLAREAEMCYITIAMATDYDSWREDTEEVGVGMVLGHMKENNKTINSVLPLVLQGLGEERACGCTNAARFAVMTDMSTVSPDAKKKLELLYGKYWK
ncbi:MAG: methylthioadenosine phosphorylase [Spirochaetes bacterium GWF1_51_8]|nr:MAG: methylthioadenosine phosphorylase [Spirochaetes bacterium GWF1_51_8]